VTPLQALPAASSKAERLESKGGRPARRMAAHRRRRRRQCDAMRGSQKTCRFVLPKLVGLIRFKNGISKWNINKNFSCQVLVF
jgi:hypothetical protein